MMDDVVQPLSAGSLHRGVAMVYRLLAPCSRSTGDILQGVLYKSVMVLYVGGCHEEERTRADFTPV